MTAESSNDVSAMHFMTSSIYFRFVATLTLFLLATSGVSSQTVCPPQCACHDVTSGLRVDCRRRSLTDIYDVTRHVSPEVVELDIGENEAIAAANRNVFPVLSRMRTLRMDRCRLQAIQRRTFDNVGRRLEVLDLSYNIIDVVEHDAFYHLSLLRVLRLDGNRLTSTSFASSVFAELTLLDLRLDSNRLQNILDELFLQLRVGSIDLSDNELNHVGASVFRPLMNVLRNLTIAGNRHGQLSIDVDAFRGMSFEQLRLPSSGLRSLAFLENLASVGLLDVSDNPVNVIALSWGSGLRLSCRVARLAAVNLSSIADAQLSNFGSVLDLDLSNNRISGTLEVVEFKATPDLRRLDLSGNIINRLPDNLGHFLSLLETLNLSGNRLTQLNAEVFDGADRISVLDVSNNKIQVVEQSLEPLLRQLTVVGLAGNPLHCNCELRWLRRLMQDVSTTPVFDGGNRNVVCVSPSSMSGAVVSRAEADFICRAPLQFHITPSHVANENTDVFLNCAVSGDPAPEVSWRSPIDERFKISPPSDRTRTRTTAVWLLQNVGGSASGWYSCNASNLAGAKTEYSYLHVASPGQPLVDLTGLEYPMLPRLLTTEVTNTGGVTSSSLTSSAVDVNSTSTGSSGARDETTLPTGSESKTTSGFVTTHAQTVSADDWTWVESTSAVPVSEPNIFIIVVGAVGCLLVLTVLVTAAVFGVRCYRKCKRQRKKRGKTGPPAPRPVLQDRIRYPTPFRPGVSMAPQGENADPLRPDLSTSPTSDPERADLLYGDSNFRTFNGRNRDGDESMTAGTNRLLDDSNGQYRQS